MQKNNILERELQLKEDPQLLYWMHLSQLLNLITGLGGFIAPLLIWVLKKDEVKDVDYEGKEIINFQISMFLYTIASAVLILFLVGFVFLGFVLIVAVVTPILQATKSKANEQVRYPLTIRFIK